jgi:predicted RNA-binding protein YlqC (UPF0109 family)
MAAAELVAYVARSLVDDPDAVAEGDMGKVIGRNGSVAKAMRTILKVVSARQGEPISLEIV